MNIFIYTKSVKIFSEVKKGKNFSNSESNLEKFKENKRLSQTWAQETIRLVFGAQSSPVIGKSCSANSSTSLHCPSFH